MYWGGKTSKETERNRAAWDLRLSSAFIEQSSGARGQFLLTVITVKLLLFFMLSKRTTTVFFFISSLHPGGGDGGSGVFDFVIIQMLVTYDGITTTAAIVTRIAMRPSIFLVYLIDVGYDIIVM